MDDRSAVTRGEKASVCSGAHLCAMDGSQRSDKLLEGNTRFLCVCSRASACSAVPAVSSTLGGIDCETYMGAVAYGIHLG